jgi:hypothetical protein
VYPTPNTHLNRGPKLLMKVDRLVHSGRRELKFVRYRDDVARNRIILEPLFEVQDVEEFEAAVKYCFLDAAELKVFGFDHQFIPVNVTFVKHLTTVCENLGTRMTESEDPEVNYSDGERSPDQRLDVRPAKCQRHSRIIGVPQKLAVSDSEDDMADFIDNEVSESERPSKKAKKTWKGPKGLQRILAQPPVSSQPEPFLHVKPPKSTDRENDGEVIISRSKLNTLTNVALDSYHIPNTPWDNEYLWSKDSGNPDRVRGRQSETTALADITNVRRRVKSNQHGSSVSGLSGTSSINESKRLHRTVKRRVSKARGLRKEHKHAATSLKEYIKRGEAFCNLKRIEMKRKSHAHRRRVELMR